MSKGVEAGFIEKTRKQDLFAEVLVQEFFAKWCEIHGVALPAVLPGELLEPHRQNQELGSNFEKAGLYLHSYLSLFSREPAVLSIVETFAQEFYSYGLSLQTEMGKTNEIKDREALSAQEMDQIDQWLLGDTLYGKRLRRLGADPTAGEKEARRKKMLQFFFRALAKEGGEAPDRNPWECSSGLIQSFQAAVQQQTIRAIETPERDMINAVYAHGVNKLLTEMPARPSEDSDKLETLYEALEIENLKQELATIRARGDVAEISNKEMAIAQKIHKAVVAFPHTDSIGDFSADHPVEMIKARRFNCVGAALLGGELLEAVGIKHLYAAVPKHAATVLLTSDHKVYWQDFVSGTWPHNFTEVTEEMIAEDISLKSLFLPLNDAGILLSFKDWRPYDQIEGHLRVRLLAPSVGGRDYILNNYSQNLDRLGRKEGSLAVAEVMIKLNPQSAMAYQEKADRLSLLGRRAEALFAYKKALEMDPDNLDLYMEIGLELGALGRLEEAVSVYQEVIRLDSKNALAYLELTFVLEDLGRQEAADVAYEKALRLDPSLKK